MRVFVLGSPRSGTTLVGNFIASHPECCDLGEYFGFSLAFAQIPSILRRVPSPVKDRFMRSLVVHAGDFADELRNEGRAKFWCDQTPWNLLIAQDLTELLPDAIFVLMLRDYRGAILSLRRSFAEGYEWAGKTVRESALVWADSYKHVPELPMERTVVVSYDRLCLSPEESIASLERELAVRLGVSDAGFDRTVFTRRHASSNMERQTIGSPDGYGALAPIEPFDATRWSDGMESASAPYVGATQALLKERFGEAYVSAGLGGS